MPLITTKMADLTEVCAGLPVDPLPPFRPRDPNVPHAPVRITRLSADEKKVSVHHAIRDERLYLAIIIAYIMAL